MAGFIDNLSASLSDVLGGFTSTLADKLKNTLSEQVIVDALYEVEEGMSDVLKTMGGGKEIAVAIKSFMAGAYTDVKLLGGEFQNIVDIQNALIENTNKQILLERDAFKDLYATTQVTNQSTESLINAFDNAGKSIYGIKDTMEGVVNISRTMGLSAQEVSNRMVSNLEKMNMYGFERGVEGLSKMAAKSAMFKLDMSSTFNLADKLMGPEEAVNFSARLQSLGIQSELIDPFRAMDLATNNVEELQNQLIKLGDGMTYVNDKGEVEIFKDKRLQIKALAQEMGMSSTELSRMIIQAETVSQKLKQIDFSSFGGDISEEKKNMIANLATLKDGKYVVSVEDKEKGVMKEKTIAELKKEDLDILTEQYTNPKKMEDLATEQTNYFRRMTNALEAIEKSPAFGIAGSKVGQGIGDVVSAGTDLIVRPLAKALDSKIIKSAMNDLANDVGDIFNAITSSANAFDGTIDGFTKLFDDSKKELSKSINSLATEFDKGVVKVEKSRTFEGLNVRGITDPVRNLLPVPKINDGFVYGQGRDKQVVQTHPDDNGFFAQREGMLKMLGGGDIIEKMKEMTRDANGRNNVDTSMVDSMSKRMNESMSKPQDVNHKMEKIEGDIKVTLDFTNVPTNVDPNMLGNVIKNNQYIQEAIVNSITKKIGNNGVTKSPSDYNRSYLNA
jgi:hypothetical protein